MTTRGLGLDLACLSEAGIKSLNEDAVAFLAPEQDYISQVKGAVVALADGVSAAEAGEEASHTAVTRFLEEYYQTPDTWSVSHSGQQVLSAINLRLFRKSHEFTDENKGYLTTFSAMVLKGCQGHFFHVGDSRIYLLRSGELKQLTRDHLAHLGNDHVFLARALGMDNLLHVDYGNLLLESGDVIMICSDGIHDVLNNARLTHLLSQDKDAQTLCRQLLNEALTAHSDDNISAAVIKVLALPHQDVDDLNAELTRLPFPPPLKTGMKLDGYEVLEELWASSRSQLYLVKDLDSGRQLVMKTPSVNFNDDSHYIDRFIREQWIGSRINHPNVVRIIQHQRPRTALYYLMERVEGVDLDEWRKGYADAKPKQLIQLVRQIAEGLLAFHANDAVHQDLKPGNILVDAQDKVKLVDFGSVFVAGVAELYRPIEHLGALGTASYSDPNYLLGRNPGQQGDVYSLATICYELFTGHLPYGETIEDCRSAADYDRLRYRSASQFNPIIPSWFDRALAKGVSFDLNERYPSVAMLMADLNRPNPELLKEEPAPKEAGKLMFWKLLSGFWFITFLVVIYLFSLSGD
ncbi:protein kinase [Aliiglaciecola sp. CAU 1673]|uniref:bifunctional protein-serine/threonine kinase/phosphatase n=1 Tax=Aliiglaciecola sp. CAU 1673 TaxID=3032595 RepID=UPI0023DA11EF|nr:bifunctional protein-serine/threonine kinase/phosphatase [Aliiglaciecola sp. CAU 1673]MDF2177403.1 protein kinase [Aliiglaciecola sp. CAU 1673]